MPGWIYHVFLGFLIKCSKWFSFHIVFFQIFVHIVHLLCDYSTSSIHLNVYSSFQFHIHKILSYCFQKNCTAVCSFLYEMKIFHVVLLLSRSYLGVNTPDTGKNYCNLFLYPLSRYSKAHVMTFMITSFWYVCFLIWVMSSNVTSKLIFSLIFFTLDTQSPLVGLSHYALKNLNIRELWLWWRIYWRKFSIMISIWKQAGRWPVSR